MSIELTTHILGEHDYTGGPGGPPNSGNPEQVDKPREKVTLGSRSVFMQNGGFLV